MIIEITNFQQLLNLKLSQKEFIIFPTFVWSSCQLQLHDFYFKGKKEQKERKKNGLPYFEVIMLVRMALSLSSLSSTVLLPYLPRLS